MYITKVELYRIRAFDHLTIDFNEQNPSTLITGDNGDGKTTILRSIAMGLTDETSCSSLLRDLPGSFIQYGRKKGHIKIELKGQKGARYKITTKFRDYGTFEQVSQEIERYKRVWRPLSPLNFPWPELYATGYGAGLRTQGTADSHYYLSVDAVYPLFKYDTALQNPELVFRRLVDGAREEARETAEKEGRKRRETIARREQAVAERVRENLLELLKLILGLDDSDAISFESNGLFVKGRWKKTELGALGDGYQAMTTLILDMLSWWFLYNKERNRPQNWLTQTAKGLTQEISGIVFVDEIEKHLHPLWQVQVLDRITKAFPKVQFILTTHSPLVLSSATGLDVHSVLHGFHKKIDVSGWLAEEVYAAMGLSTSRPTILAEKIDRFRALHMKRVDSSLEKSERAEFGKLRRQLANLPEADPIVTAIQLENLTERLRKKSSKVRGR